VLYASFLFVIPDAHLIERCTLIQLRSLMLLHPKGQVLGGREKWSRSRREGEIVAARQRPYGHLHASNE
jgi:hypothetical protein